MHAPLAKWKHDFTGDVMRALHQVGDDNDVANAFAAVGSKVSFHVFQWFTGLTIIPGLVVIFEILALFLPGVGRQIIAFDIVRVNVFTG